MVYRLQKHSWLVLLVLLLLIVGGGYAVARSLREREIKKSAPSPVPEETTLSGKIVCLPYRDTSGPVTLECAYGLQTDSGQYYALDTRNVSPTMIGSLPVGEHLTVTGSLLPEKDVDRTVWERYDIVGILLVTSSQ